MMMHVAFQEVSYEWNSPKEANKAVGYGPWAHIGTLGALTGGRNDILNY